MTTIIRSLSYAAEMLGSMPQLCHRRRAFTMLQIAKKLKRKISD